MSTETAHAFLALMLDAPLMSFEHSSRFQRRTTALHPTRSALLGMVCAAAGADKGSAAEAAWLERLGEAAVAVSVLAIPRQPAGSRQPVPVLRLEDYHTVLDTRRASGAISKDAVVSHRQYLLDARFGVILAGPRATLDAVAAALRNPQWGIWFGRKSCIPAAPVVRGLASSQPKALRMLDPDGRAIEEFDTVTDAATFADGTDTLMDAPVSFATRQFRPRRIAARPREASSG